MILIIDAFWGRIDKKRLQRADKALVAAVLKKEISFDSILIEDGVASLLIFLGQEISQIGILLVDSPFLPRLRTTAIEGKVLSMPHARHRKRIPIRRHMRMHRQRFKANFHTQHQTHPFSEFCYCGIYEYFHPVIENDQVEAMIMIGNILRTDAPVSYEMEQFRDSFEVDYPEEKCQKLAAILEGHIRLLLENYAHRQSEYPPLVNNIRNYLAEFLYSDISVSELASAFNYSEKYIGRVFKAQTGQSIRDYLCHKRLLHAAKLLKSGNQTVTQIASASGFNNVTYFNRIFKQQYGMTPSEYRKKA